MVLLWRRLPWMVMQRSLTTTTVALRRSRTTRSNMQARQLLLQHVESYLQQQQQHEPQPRLSIERQQQTTRLSELVVACAGHAGIEDLSQWLESLRANACKPSTQVYNVCLAACTERPDMAEVWFQDMRAQQLRPDAETYRAMMAVHAGDDVWEASRWLIRFLADPVAKSQRRDFLSMLQAAARSGQPVLVESWQRELAVRQRPLGAEAQDREAILRVMAMQSARGQPFECMAWHGILLRLVAMARPGPGKHRAKQLAWDLVLQSFVACADFTGARAWGVDMKAVGVAPAARTFTKFLHLGLAQQPGTAAEWLAGPLREEDLEALFDSCRTASDIHALWAQAQTLTGAATSSSSVQAARVSALLRVGDWTSAALALQQMVAADEGQTSLADKSKDLVRQLATACATNPPQATQLLRALLASPGPNTDLLADLAYDLLTDSTQRALQPVLSAQLMHVYARRKTPRKAVHCMRQLMVSGQRPDRLVFDGLLAAYAAVGRPEVTLATFQRMQNEGFKPDAKTYTHIIQAYRNAGDCKTAEKWITVMHEAGFPPTASDSVKGPAL